MRPTAKRFRLLPLDEKGLDSQGLSPFFMGSFKGVQRGVERSNEGLQIDGRQEARFPLGLVQS